MDADTVVYMPRDMAKMLRDVIRQSRLSALALAGATGVSQPTITEFLRGKDIRLKTAQKIADHFGLELTKKQPTTKRRRQR